MRVATPCFSRNDYEDVPSTRSEHATLTTFDVLNTAIWSRSDFRTFHSCAILEATAGCDPAVGFSTQLHRFTGVFLILMLFTTLPLRNNQTVPLVNLALRNPKLAYFRAASWSASHTIR